jgi:hypothetical protein
VTIIAQLVFNCKSGEKRKHIFPFDIGPCEQLDVI